MVSNVDETELARLEELATHYARVVALDNVSIPHQIIKSVPALVAELRRLRAEAKQGGIDYCALMDRHDAQFVRAEKLREKVEAWEWFEECFEVTQWFMANGQATPESRIVDVLSSNACVESVISTNFARERAVHADRE